MKLWYSFVKELLLASRGFYFWVEIIVAVVIVAVMLILVPEHSTARQTEYIYLDMPVVNEAVILAGILTQDEDGEVEILDIQLEEETIQAMYYQTEDRNIYMVDTEEHAVALADSEQAFAAVIGLDESGDFTYTYYMQGYETERLQNIYKVLHLADADTMQETLDAQDVRQLEESPGTLNDREFVLPTLLAMNGSLFGLFIVAAYVFLDKKEGVIKAYAVTASPIWHYLMSKTGVLILVTLFTTIFITAAVAGGTANYLLIIILLITSGFCAAALGLLLSSFYDDILQAFGVLYALIIVLALPTIAYFIPTWDPAWMQIIPTYPLIHSFKEALLDTPNVSYVLMTSLAFLVGGVVIFVIANMRFKKTFAV